jgi:hypothetical protein
MTAVEFKLHQLDLHKLFGRPVRNERKWQTSVDPRYDDADGRQRFKLINCYRPMKSNTRYSVMAANHVCCQLMQLIIRQLSSGAAFRVAIT